jgi:hypothetical protein
LVAINRLAVRGEGGEDEQDNLICIYQ